MTDYYFAPWRDPYALGAPCPGPSNFQLAITLIAILVLGLAIVMRPC